MNLHNILDNTCRNFLVAIVLLIGTLPAQANMTYNFTTNPVFVGEAKTTLGEEVQTNPGVLNFPNSPPVLIGSPLNASLTFASPLASSSITSVHLESGGFNLQGATQGGLQSYSAGISLFPITSNIDTYLTGSAGTVFNYSRYSAVDGQVTTNASGHISAWNLNFILYDDGNGGGITLNQSTNPRPPFLMVFRLT